MKFNLLTLIHCENSTQLKFQDGGYIYALPKELEMPSNAGISPVYINDGYHQGICRPWQIVLVDLPDVAGYGPVEATLHSYICDVRKLFATVLKMRDRWKAALQAWKDAGNKEWLFKWENQVLDLDRFQHKPEPSRRLTVMQLLKHEGVMDRQQMAASLKLFHAGLPAEKWDQLMERLSDYAPRARLYGQRDEIYFDGRNVPDGLGFNGGIILRDKEFSIHT
jgi:hypothetical protein